MQVDAVHVTVNKERHGSGSGSRSDKGKGGTGGKGKSKKGGKGMEKDEKSASKSISSREERLGWSQAHHGTLGQVKWWCDEGTPREL